LAEENAVSRDLEQAQAAAMQGAWEKVIAPALRARRAAQSTYLHSVVVNTPLPEIPAIIAVIDSLILSAQASALLIPLRDAEHLALRALYTLRHLPFLSNERRHQVGTALTNRLEAITRLQVEIVQHGQPTPNGQSNPQPGFGLSLLRIDSLLQTTGEVADGGRNELALWPCETAVADLLIVLTTLKQMSGFLSGVDPGSEFVQKLRASGAETAGEQEALSRQIVERYLLQTLQQALSLLANLQNIAGDVVGAAEASQLLVAAAEALSTDGQFVVSEDQFLREAYACIEYANSLAAIEDDPSLNEAHKVLDKAEKLLDKVGEEGTHRAWLCLARASILHSQRRLEGALDIIARGLRAAANEPDNTGQCVRELMTIRSQFLIHAGDINEALEVAQGVVALPEGDTLRDRLNRASHYLNLAIIQIELNDAPAAEESLRQGLRRALVVAPFGEEALRILMVASRLYMELAPRLSYQLNLAAAANLDVRRAQIPSDKYRIDFDESTRRREVYGDLVGRLVAFDAGKEAVAAADRSRARSLNELLIAPQWDPEQPQPLSEEAAPTLDGDDVRQALWEGAEYAIRNADAALIREGALRPLRAAEVPEFAQAVGTPALIIQPVRHQVALLLTRPSGEIVTEFSSLPRAQLMDMVDTVQRSLHIYGVPRGESEATPPVVQSTELYETLEVLWDGLLGPVADHLVDGEPLILVPYREFTLVPFALLRNPEGRWLVDDHALSVVPSLATLRTLWEREAWTRTLPSRVFVAGDPAAHPKYLLKRLSAARTEAQNVVLHLKAAGVPAEHIVLRLGKEAHEASYQLEARGCDLVHVSCHAQLKEPAYTSRLYFAPYEPHDGLLLAAEIANVRLNDALVFLGACETGQGRATADSIVGLGRAFLEAGARAVILSLWKVEDTATAALSDQFYHALFRGDGKCDVGGALRAAMLAVRADLEAGKVIGSNGKPLEAHPAYWAPFIILGDAFSVDYGMPPQ